MSIVDDIYVKLTDNGFVCYKAYVPPGSVATVISDVVVFPAGGIAPEHTVANNDCVTDKPQFQILVRNRVFESGMETAEQIRNILDGISNETINGNFYYSINMIGDINYIGITQTNAGGETREFTINFETQKRRN